MRSDRRLRAALLAVTAVTVAACGSTVPVSDQQAAEAAAEQGLTDGGLGVDGTGSTGAATGSGSVGGTGGGTGSLSGGTGSAGGSTTGSGATGSAGATGTTVAGANGPGISADEIKVGLAYAADGTEANAALGAAGATQVDYERAYDAVVEWVNERGGIGGRKVVPVYHRLRLTSSETQDQQDQEMCARFTEDDPVFASNGGFVTENGVACLEEAGTVIVGSNGLRFKSGAFFETYPHYLEFDGIDVDDLSVLYADSLAKHRYYAKDGKFGLLTWDDPNFTGPTQQTFMPALKRHGVELTDIAYIKNPQSQDDNAEMVAQIGNAALRFKGEGITHVMFLDQGGQLAFFFMQAAERQQYRPRYGLNSSSGGNALIGLLRSGGDGDARNQLKGAVGVGFFPVIDVPPDETPAWGRPQSQKLCYSIMNDNGITMDSANARAQAELVCNTLWVMDATIEAAGKVVNQDTYLEGLNEVTIKDVEPTSGMGLAISSTRRDGTAYAAQVKYFDECICFRYVSGQYEVPDR